MPITLTPILTKKPEALLPGDVIVAKRPDNNDPGESMDYADSESHMYVVVTIACNDISSVFIKEIEDDGDVDEEVICVDLNKTKYAYLGSYRRPSVLERWFCTNLKPYDKVYSAA